MCLGQKYVCGSLQFDEFSCFVFAYILTRSKIIILKTSVDSIPRNSAQSEKNLNQSE